MSNKTVAVTKTGFYLICCNAFSQNSTGSYLNIRVDGGQYMSAYNSNQVATLSLSTVLFLRDGQTVAKEVIIYSKLHISEKINVNNYIYEQT